MLLLVYLGVLLVVLGLGWLVERLRERRDGGVLRGVLLDVEADQRAAASEIAATRRRAEQQMRRVTYLHQIGAGRTWRRP